MKITKKQIITLSEKFGNDNATGLRSNLTTYLKEWFPEAFETVLEVGKWYKARYGSDTAIVNYQGTHSYGIGICNLWTETFRELKDLEKEWELSEATESEVFEALKNEAVKRGYKNGNHRCLNSCITESRVEDTYHMDNGDLWYGTNVSANCVFKKGVWAEIIPTITKEEAEKLLNKKIV